MPCGVSTTTKDLVTVIPQFFPLSTFRLKTGTRESLHALKISWVPLTTTTVPEWWYETDPAVTAQSMSNK